MLFAVPRSSTFAHGDTLNLGVGGEKVANVLYRISLGLLELLTPFSVRLWVIHIGSNNLRRGYGRLRPFEIAQIRLLLDAVLCASDAETKVLLCGIFERRDIGGEQVRRSNELMLQAVHETNSQQGMERIFWQGQPQQIDLRKHLADKAHLNRKGYEIWDQALSTRITELIRLTS